MDSKKSPAESLIGRMERETGHRVDDNNFDNNAIAGLMGAMARMLGNSSHDEHDDFAAGILIKAKLEETDEDRAHKAMRDAAILRAVGIDPDEAK